MQLHFSLRKLAKFQEFAIHTVDRAIEKEALSILLVGVILLEIPSKTIW